MRKLLALVTLFAYLAMTPMAFAEETSIYVGHMCPLKSMFLNNPVLLEEHLAASYKESNCGEKNSATSYLEKGDCTAEGKVITEISEVIGSDTEVVGDGTEENPDNKIITVYKGTCCLSEEKDESGNMIGCTDVRSLYTKSYEDCTKYLLSCEKRQWIIGVSGAGILKVYVKQLYRWGAVTVGFIAVVTIIVSGIQISISGVSGDITSAKNRILQAIAGLVLLFLSGIILYTINPTFFS